MRRLREDDEIGPSKGFMKYFHKFMMLLLFPLRKPIWFALIVIVLFLAPTFRGVKPTEVHNWYWSKIKTSSSTVSTLVSNTTKEYMPNLPKIEMPTFTDTSKDQAKVPSAQIVDMPVKEVRRKTFERAKSAPVAVDIMLQNNSENAQPAANPATLAPVKVMTSGAPVVATNAKKKLALVYTNEAKKINGNAVVINANEIKIGADDIILYGIYVNPQSEQGRMAQTYLNTLVNNQHVDCVVEAYTYQGVATGICSVGAVNINKSLIEKGYSRNVALD